VPVGPTLVTGATGTLGRLVLQQLGGASEEVRGLSRRRRPEPGWYTGDLITGEGIDEAVRGARTIVHCATTVGRIVDEATTAILLDAAQRAGVSHVVYISIVGIDRVPLPYYKAKLAAERRIEGSGVPWTTLRTTQFHDFIYRLWTVAARFPLMLVPSIPFQPIDTGEVAQRLAELANGEPRGRVTDMGGPQVCGAQDLARAYLRASGRRRAVVGFRAPGETFRAYREGLHTTPSQATGRITFEQFLNRPERANGGRR
jgi:uncharacterized protein YbjT (DUF2867 family)